MKPKSKGNGSGKTAFERHQSRQLRMKWLFYGAIALILLFLLAMVVFIES